jgi:hypothetical protein
MADLQPRKEASPASWGDTIRSYESAKKTLPWKETEVQPVQKIGLLEVLKASAPRIVLTLSYRED